MKARPRYVPREWLKALRSAYAEMTDPKSSAKTKDAARERLRDLGKRRLPPDHSGEIRPCPLCNDTGFEHREAMTDRRHPIPIQWPCRNGCTQMTKDRKERPVPCPQQTTDRECRGAWQEKTGGRFLLAGEEPF